MANDIVQINYDEMADIGTIFGNQADIVSELRSDLNRYLQELQAGGWEGRGADAFFSEYESTISPTLDRLVTAFEEAEGLTQQIIDTFMLAEEEAAGQVTFEEDGIGRSGGAASGAGGVGAGGSGGSLAGVSVSGIVGGVGSGVSAEAPIDSGGGILDRVGGFIQEHRGPLEFAAAAGAIVGTYGLAYPVVREVAQAGYIDSGLEFASQYRDEIAVGAGVHGGLIGSIPAVALLGPAGPLVAPFTGALGGGITSSLTTVAINDLTGQSLFDGVGPNAGRGTIVGFGTGSVVGAATGAATALAGATGPVAAAYAGINGINGVATAVNAGGLDIILPEAWEGPVQTGAGYVSTATGIISIRNTVRNPKGFVENVVSIGTGLFGLTGTDDVIEFGDSLDN